MPNTKSAKKRLRQNEARRLRNRSLQSEIRTRTRKLLEQESSEGADEQLSKLHALLDRAARKRVVHPKAAARRKARLARHVAGLEES